MQRVIEIFEAGLSAINRRLNSHPPPPPRSGSRSC